MPGITHEKIIEILKDYRKHVSWETWKVKGSIMFTIKAKYGEAINMKSAGAIYDSLLEQEETEKGLHE